MKDGIFKYKNSYIKNLIRILKKHIKIATIFITQLHFMSSEKSSQILRFFLNLRLTKDAFFLSKLQ